MKIVVSPNPYRDKQFKHARQACQILKEAGAEVSLCLPFDVDRSFEIPSDLRFREIQKEIRTADMLICFGGDGTILHSSKIATEHGLPILGVNIGTMGFIAELEASEMELLRKIPQGDYTVEPRTMLDVSVVSGKQTLFHETALNDAVITKGAIARVVQLSITCDVDKMQRVFDNLLRNAVLYCYPGTEITVTAERVGNFAVVRFQRAYDVVRVHER